MKKNKKINSNCFLSGIECGFARVHPCECVCVYVGVYVYVCVRACVCGCVCVFMCGCVCDGLWACSCACACARMRVRVCMPVFVSIVCAFVEVEEECLEDCHLLGLREACRLVDTVM